MRGAGWLAVAAVYCRLILEWFVVLKKQLLLFARELECGIFSGNVKGTNVYNLFTVMYAKGNNSSPLVNE